MKTLWCWRCKKNVPMLEEHEFQEIEAMRRKLDESRTALLEKIKTSPIELEQLKALKQEEYRRANEIFQAITGAAPTSFHHEVYKHRASIYGPPCPNCRKVLRTPTAKQCFECGWMK